MIKNCIFDFDGTLVDSKKDVLDCLVLAFDKAGIPMLPPDPEIVMQQQLREAIRSIAPDLSIDRQDQIVAYFKKHYDGSDYPHTVLMPTALELLEALKAKSIPCFIVSNKRRFPLLKILDKLEIREYFMDIFTPDMDSDPKTRITKSELLAAVTKKHNLPKATTAYVGDMEGDVIAAKKNSLIAIAIPNGYSAADSYTIRPDYSIERLNDILEIV